jgi:hypothetical protein
MKTHSCFRLLTNALTGAILFTTTALQAQAADQVKVTDLMTKDLVNLPGKEVTMSPWTIRPAVPTRCIATTRVLSSMFWRGRL